MYKLPSNIENFSYKNIQDLANKKIIVRSCLNVATDSQGKVTDRTRLNESMPLISELAGNARRLIIMAHLGRPERDEKQFSFWNVAELIQGELTKVNSNLKLKLVRDLDEIKNSNEDSNTVYLIENIRFFKAEESKALEDRMAFAEELAELADVFINDAFADYRESASTYDIATLLPSFLGPKFLQEVEALSKFSNPQKPFIAVLGGAKLSEKLDALKSLAEIADKVVIGGAMAYTLLKAKGIKIGNSLFEADKLEVAKEIMDQYSDKIVLPNDHLVCDVFNEKSAQNSKIIDEQDIPNGKIAIDLGPNSIQLYMDELSKAKSILWNGPMGVTEWEISSKGTKAVGEGIANNQDAYVLAGGGDSIAAINKYNLSGFDHISTGGGAMLAFIAYDKFPTLDIVIN